MVSLKGAILQNMISVFIKWHAFMAVKENLEFANMHNARRDQKACKRNLVALKRSELCTIEQKTLESWNHFNSWCNTGLYCAPLDHIIYQNYFTIYNYLNTFLIFQLRYFNPIFVPRTFNYSIRLITFVRVNKKKDLPYEHAQQQPSRLHVCMRVAKQNAVLF